MKTSIIAVAALAAALLTTAASPASAANSPAWCPFPVSTTGRRGNAVPAPARTGPASRATAIRSGAADYRGTDPIPIFRQQLMRDR